MRCGSFDKLLHRLDRVLDRRFVDFVGWDDQGVGAVGVLSKAHSFEDVFGAGDVSNALFDGCVVEVYLSELLVASVFEHVVSERGQGLEAGFGDARRPVCSIY